MYDEVEMKPTLYISDKDLDELRNNDLELNEVYELTIKAKVVNLGTSNGKNYASFEVQEIKKSKEEDDINKMDNKQFDEYAGKQKRRAFK